MADPTPDADTVERFHRTARTALAVLLEADPAQATALGEHRYDHLLPDLSPSGSEGTVRHLTDAIGALDDLDDAELGRQDAVDLELLRARLTARHWALSELAEQRWDPLQTLPGDALYSLVARDTGEPEERAAALASRLAALPAYLQGVRDQLGVMPAVHVQTAAQQCTGSLGLLGDPVEELLVRAPGMRAGVDAVRGPAAQALTGHARWLTDRLADAVRDPRLGPRAYAARLWYSLDTHVTPDALLDRAESDLMAVEAEISEVAARLAPRLGVSAEPQQQVRAVLDALAAGAAVDDQSVLRRCEHHLSDLTRLVREHDLVMVPDDAVEIIEMPPSRRGVAVAYCDPPGPLEPDGPHGPPPTFFAVAPSAPGWTAERIASFYREYNDHMLRDLTVHEAMPGHVLQLAHARRFAAATAVRAALWSGPFVEGWAVYAEQLLAQLHLDLAGDGGDGPDAVAALALRMQQLKMRLRCTINAILDVRVHTRAMTEQEGLRLMLGRGHQEEGEAVGKWRRALLTSGQLATYYVGYTEVAAVAADLQAARPGAAVRAVHDELLSHGSPSPRLLRGLLSLDPPG